MNRRIHLRRRPSVVRDRSHQRFSRHRRQELHRRGRDDRAATTTKEGRSVGQRLRRLDETRAAAAGAHYHLRQLPKNNVRYTNKKKTAGAQEGRADVIVVGCSALARFSSVSGQYCGCVGQGHSVVRGRGMQRIGLRDGRATTCPRPS